MQKETSDRRENGNLRCRQPFQANQQRRLR